MNCAVHANYLIEIKIWYQIHQGELRRSNELSRRMNLFYRNWFHHGTDKKKKNNLMSTYKLISSLDNKK